MRTPIRVAAASLALAIAAHAQRLSVGVVAGTNFTANCPAADTAQCSVSPGNWITQTVAQSLGDIGGTKPKQAQTNLSKFAPVTVELRESVIFNYQVINKADPDPNVVDAALNKAGASLAQAALNSIAKQLGAGITATSSVPVLGAVLGLLRQWLISQLVAIIFVKCDGIVALEQVVLTGRDLHLKTTSGKPYAVTTIHPGTDSTTGCGANSKYEVTWSITRV